MITLTAPWNSGYALFPIGTVFIPHEVCGHRTVWSYATPNGGHGKCVINHDKPAPGN
jgi:hypothetical protein